MFSLPLNNRLRSDEVDRFIDFLINFKEHVYDFYFTCRIPPFEQDAMGDTFGNNNLNNEITQLALEIQKYSGVTASAVFNNIEVRPTIQNLSLFVDNFAPWYERGVRSITIPHTHWMATGVIKKEFPDIFVKNTVLRKVSEPREIAELAKAGFDYINLDRVLMRDQERLLRIKKAKEVFNVKTSILGNEGCLGGCIMMDEHYLFNNTRTEDGPRYFSDEISSVSCSKWSREDSAYRLKTADIPVWKEDYDYFLNDMGIDVIKMHGREVPQTFWQSLSMVERYAMGAEFLDNDFSWFAKFNNLEGKPLQVWREKIKTCRFDCWDCGFCDKLMANRNKAKDD